MKIEITNRQKIKRINLKGLRKKLIKVGAQNFSSLRGISAKKISILLCDNKFITSLNRRYFKKSCPTDVIAFPLEDNFDPGYLGEIVVSVEEAVKVADTCWQKEALLYCIHGILHLVGYDDRNKKQRERMEEKQEQILRKII